MENLDLKLIKDKYGEKMMHLCRELFPTILETNGLLFNILSSNFAYSRYLYEDIINNNKEDEFAIFINSNINHLMELKKSTKRPEELLRTKGYTLYECHTNSDIDQFKKYYYPGEELCTFDSDKLNKYYIFFAVKDNALSLKRESFTNPLREDEYGTSVISIQFRKSIHNDVSIKNRYNHTVPNPDATFYNNLELIVPGLTNSFETTYNFHIRFDDSIKFELPNYIRAKDGKYYRYNYKISNIYYCPNNVIIVNNNPIDVYSDKEKYLVIDYFVINLEDKTISTYDSYIDDGLPKSLGDIVKIDIINDGDNKFIYITQEENTITICVNKYNQIISYQDDYGQKLADNFLVYNKTITTISLPNVTTIGNNFLATNTSLNSIYAPHVRKVGNYAIFEKRKIPNVMMPSNKHSLIRRLSLKK